MTDAELADLERVARSDAVATGMSCVGSDRLLALVALARAGRRCAAAVADELRRRADLYEKGGQPGELGYNCWGWRDIARHLREAAAALADLPGG